MRSSCAERIPQEMRQLLVKTWTFPNAIVSRQANKLLPSLKFLWRTEAS